MWRIIIVFVLRLVEEGLNPEKAIDIARRRFGIYADGIEGKIKN